MGIELSAGYCEHCKANVQMQRKTPNHILHLLLSILTCGLWLLVWLMVVVDKPSWQCLQCGSNLGGGSHGWGILGLMLSHKPAPRLDLMKTCPYCAEQIKAAATVCRFCNKELPQETVVNNQNNSIQEQQTSNGYVQIFFVIGVVLFVIMFISIFLKRIL